MSRAASVDLNFIAKLEEAEQLFEAFKRKAQVPIPISFTGASSGAQAAGSTTTTFGNAATASAPYESGMREAVSRRSDSERRVADANERLATATKREAAAREEAAERIKEPTILGTKFSKLSKDFRERLAAADPRIAAYVAQESRAAEPPPVEQPGPAENMVEGDEEEREVRRSRRPKGPPRPPRQRGILGGFASSIGLATAAHAVGQMANETFDVLKTVQNYEMEPRLAVNPATGSPDTMRQYQANQDLIKKMEGMNRTNELISYFHERSTGSQEAARRAVEQSDAMGAFDKTAAGESASRLAISRRTQQGDQSGPFRQSFFELATSYQEEVNKARESRDSLTEAARKQGTTPSENIQTHFEETINDLNDVFYKSFSEINNRWADQARMIKATGPGLVARSSGRYREAARLDIIAQADVDVASEQDPGLRELKRTRGGLELRAFDAEGKRRDQISIQESTFMREAFERRGAGDLIGSTRASQSARRARELGFPDLSTAGAAATYLARQKALDAQDDVELRSVEADVTFNKATLAGGRDVSGLLAAGKPRGADVESILLKAVAGGNRLSKLGLKDEAALTYETGLNELMAYRRNLQTLGTAAETAPGAFGEGGTAGSGGKTQETDKELADRIEAAISDLKSAIVSALNGDGL